MKFNTVTLEINKLLDEIVKRKPDKITMNYETFDLIKDNINTTVVGNRFYFFGARILFDENLEIGEIQFFIEVKD